MPRKRETPALRRKRRSYFAKEVARIDAARERRGDGEPKLWLADSIVTASSLTTLNREWLYGHAYWPQPGQGNTYSRVAFSVHYVRAFVTVTYALTEDTSAGALLLPGRVAAARMHGRHDWAAISTQPAAYVALVNPLYRVAQASRPVYAGRQVVQHGARDTVFYGGGGEPLDFSFELGWKVDRTFGPLSSPLEGGDDDIMGFGIALQGSSAPLPANTEPVDPISVYVSTRLEILVSGWAGANAVALDGKVEPLSATNIFNREDWMVVSA